MVQQHPSVNTAEPPVERCGARFSEGLERRSCFRPDNHRGDHAAYSRAPDAVVDDEDFHDACGYRWSLHDNSTPLNAGPFGCPSETYARMRWGDR